MPTKKAKGKAAFRAEPKKPRKKKKRISRGEMLELWSPAKKPSRALVKREATTPDTKKPIPPSRALVKRETTALAKTEKEPFATPGLTEAAVRRQLNAGFASAMAGAPPPPAVVDEIVRSARRRKKPQQLTQLIARYVPGSPARHDDAKPGHWIIPKKVVPEQLTQCSPEQLEWARACIRSARKAKRIKRGGRRWRAVTRDYLASL
jgi:hypothetical protein